MTGLIIAFALAILTGGAILALARVPIRLMSAPAAALMLGLAGYAWQGRPDLAGQSRSAANRPSTFDERIIERRRALSDRLGPANKWLVLSDGLGRQGASEDAANILVSGLREFPRDPALWVGLGNALLVHGDGLISPAAAFAYGRAEELAPAGVAPRYFHGLALAQSRQLPQAKAVWLGLLRDLPEKSDMRFELARNLVLIDGLMAREGERNGAPQP